jgi:hypothetical protein
MKTTFRGVSKLKNHLVGSIKFEEGKFVTEDINFIVENNTVFHIYAMKHEELKQIIDYCLENCRGYLTAIGLKNANGVTPFELAYKGRNAKTVRLLLLALAEIGQDHLSNVFYEYFPDMINAGLKSFHEFLDTCTFQTVQMKNIQYLSMKSERDVILAPHSSCVLSEKFLRKHTNLTTEDKYLKRLQIRLQLDKDRFEKEKDELERMKIEMDKQATSVSNHMEGDSGNEGLPEDSYNETSGVVDSSLEPSKEIDSDQESQDFSSETEVSGYGEESEESEESESLNDGGDEVSYEEDKEYSESGDIDAHNRTTPLKTDDIYYDIGDEEDERNERYEDIEENEGNEGEPDFLRSMVELSEEQQIKILQYDTRFDENKNKMFLLDEEIKDFEKRKQAQYERTKQTLQKYDVQAIEFSWLFNHAHRKNFLKALTNTKDIEIFSLDIVKNILMFLWGYYRGVIFGIILIPFLIYFLTFILYASYINRRKEDETNKDGDYHRANDALIIIIFIGIIMSFILEVSKIIYSYKSYLMSFWNIISLISLVLNFFVVTADLSGMGERTLLPPMAIAVLLMWIRFFYFGRVFLSTAWMVRMIYSVIKEIGYFLLIFFLMVIGFANVFFIIQRIENNNFAGDTFWKAITYSYL